LVAAAVCPHPPLIVPEIAAAAAPELDDLRARCTAAIAALVAARPDRLITVGVGPATRVTGADERYSFAPYGLGTAGTLPLSLSVGAWLIERAGEAGVELAGVTLAGQCVARDTPAGTAAELGAALAADGRVALLVMGDGSACRGVKAPGSDDPRALPYDDGVAQALADADRDALLGLDPALSAELLVAGRPAWQVLAGAARAPMRGALTYHAAPYGVAYFVAAWTPA
jgi:hypothetical protein